MKKILILLILLIPFTLSAQLDTVNTGSAPDAGDGDPGRTAFTKVNVAIKTVDTNVLRLDTLTLKVDTNALRLDTLTLRVDTNAADIVNIDTSINDTSTLNEAMQDIDTILVNNNGIFALPQRASEPTAIRLGQMYYDTVSDEIKFWNGTSWVTI